ncbi:MAG: 3-methyl-2-oxobutanoate hydroxymethyltransferase [Leptospiraceae bacterium]|nr:3-methyl-2-oxobutanoate hydroxymethyltransferase [Leptospiraceae bacterium]MCK6382036.1 3-methyl-2-oxobutanoate hydroxymethyltransferase [Leptospiraceae bacterium]NUM40801.1 3-methyl-2-oxobutanoate hydroxymethyltransferase [Leptospiraceae bacterium]
MRNIIEIFKKKKLSKTPISVVTCYDYTFSKIISETDVDCILVGDSLGMVIQGNESTLPVTLEEMIYHSKSVRKGSPDKCIVCDLPFLSYQVSIEEGIRSAGKVMKESGCDAIKIEGGGNYMFELTRRLNEIGIPVMGHLGLTPQSFQTLGGFKLQGKEISSQEKMKQDAIHLEKAGNFSVVLEMIPETLGEEITKNLSTSATIGIGAGRKVDGQVLVLYDLLGFGKDFHPKFLKKYASLYEVIKNALDNYSKEVESQSFPEEKNIF